MGHDNMYWYQQDPGMELQLIHYSYGVNTTEKGERPSRSTASWMLMFIRPQDTVS
ncbi:hypothetical protein Celaphus_00012345, partial [Cervus elaphus hippelaphus]